MVSFTDTLNYITYKNPVSQTAIAGISQLARASGLQGKASHSHSIGTQTMSTGSRAIIPIQKQLGSSSHLIRVAAISGAAAVCLAAYGRHHMKDTPETKEYRSIYESANNMHLIHSVALLATPLAKRPLITGSLFISGIILFSGTCYYKAIKKSKGESVEYLPARLAPYGGVCLILGWLSLLL